MLKPARSSIACEFCRHSKIKCRNKGDDSSCERCVKLGREECIYKPKGFQQAKRSLKRSYSKSNEEIDSKKITSNKNHYYNGHYLSLIKFPPQFLLLKVINIFFSNQYNGIFQFIHKDQYLNYYKSIERLDQTYLLNINQRNKNHQLEFDPILLLAILSICSRFEPSMVGIYGSFNEDDNPDNFEPNFNLFEMNSTNEKLKKTPYNASNYFGYFARQLIKDVFDKPSIQRIQALSILSSHEWGNCNASRSYLYNGIAARMAIILGLNNPRSLSYKKIHDDETLSTFDKTVKLETYRRTMWSVYMMDRANASGRNRSFAVKIEEIRISLPCSDLEFENGVITKEYSNYDKSLELLSSVKFDSEDNLISLIGYQIFFFELWSKISKWCGEVGSVKENLSPMNKNSNFNKLIFDLNLLESKLPKNLKFSIENLTYHIKINNVEQFGYLNCLIFLSKTFLYREIFYLKNYISDDENSLISFHDWWQYTKLLLNIVKNCSNLIKTLKSVNLIVDAPFLAFQIFTNTIICLYFVSFSNEFNNTKFNKYNLLNIEKLNGLKIEFEKLRELNSDLLEKNIWTLGEKYFSIIKNLNNENLKKYIVIDTLKNKIHDYGQSEIVEDEEPDTPTSSRSSAEPNDRDQSPSAGKLNESASSFIENPQPLNSFSSNTTDSNINDLIEGFGYENWENFDMGNVLPGWNTVVDMYSPVN